ncbi:MAG: ABC transporter permease [Pseudomonadota bacterium]|nr:ABC transporter permease [Pseudomonadota bacterium]
MTRIGGVTEVNPKDMFVSESFGQKCFRLARQKKLGAFGAVIIIAMVLMAVFANSVSPYDPLENNYTRILEAPSSNYWLGTDRFGRDILSRIIHGSRTALFIGILSAFLGATTGLILGLASGYFGGAFDLIFMRFIDLFMAFPPLIMVMAIVATFGNELHFVVFAISISIIPDSTRIIRSNALQVRRFPYIDAAVSLGFGHARIILRHMLPNVMASYLIIFTAAVGGAILAEAALSFLGLGVNEPLPAWGLMLQGATEESMTGVYWTAVFPGLAITLAVFAFFVWGDALRDLLDPRLREK